MKALTNKEQPSEQINERATARSRVISWHLQDDPHPRLVRILRLGDSREWDAYGSMCGPMKENTCSHWQSYWSSLLCVRISADGADISAARET